MIPLLLVALLSAPAPAHADRVSRLCKILGDDPCLQSQLRAVVALGRLQSPRAVECIAPFLKSPSPSVRLITARSLGQIGTAAARQRLERRQDIERDTRVAQELNDAVARVIRRADALAGAARVVVTVQPMSNPTGKGEPELPLALAEALARELDMVPGWVIRHEAAEPAPKAAGARQSARSIQVGGKVVQLNRGRQRAGVEYSCVVQLTLRDSAKVAPESLRLSAKITTPLAGHYTALDSAFFSDLMEVAGRLAARRLMAAAAPKQAAPPSPKRSPTIPEGK